MAILRPLDKLFQAWQKLPRPISPYMPMRRTLNLQCLSSLLPVLSIMRRESRYNITVGLMGTQASHFWDQSITGMNAFDLISPSMKENAAKIYSSILDYPTGAIIKENIQKRTDQVLNVATLYLPMCDRIGEPKYIIGCSTITATEKFPALADHVITEARQIARLKFFDIGRGTPDVKFDIPSMHPDVFSTNNEQWWRKLLSLKTSGASASHKGDAHTPPKKPH